MLISLNTLFEFNEINHDVIIALERKLIKLTDFTYRGRWGDHSYHGNFKEDVRQLVLQDKLARHPYDEAETQRACVNVQKHWRGRKVRHQFTLFKDLHEQMQRNARSHDSNVSFQNLHQLSQFVAIKQLIESGKTSEASSELQKLKIR